MQNKLRDFRNWLIVFLGVIFVCICIVISGNRDMELEEKIKQCFMEQIENTPECKYLIYKGQRSCSKS